MAFLEKVKKAALWFAKTYWFYIGLAIFVVIARFAPNFARHGGLIRAEYTIGYGAVAVIFLGSGLSMSTKQLMANMANWRAHTVVLVLQFLVTPAIMYGFCCRRKRAPDAVRGVHRQHAGSLYYAGAVPDVLQRSVGIRQPGKRLIDYAGVQRRDAADRVQRVCADVCGTGGAEPVPETDQVVSHHVPVQQGGLVYAAAGDVFVVFNGVLPARVHGREPRVDHSGVFFQRRDLHAVHGDLLCCVAANFLEKNARACRTGCVCLVPQNCGSVLLRPSRHSGRDAVRRGENGRTGGVAGVGTVRRQERVPGTAAGAAGAVPERAGAVCGLPDPVHEDVDPCRGQKQGCWE
ncbi:hypothetical protein KL928_005195 [Ogataea angusta]|uniref:Uncharacterized protein n=1 Tax=Pichia angusta TaxID=870730 RepID=A0AAN6DAX0_PICAN|nr:uncharacterized protein KL928_005195 [Ogataea angusta]KAG7815856.1 hypothetical protein KL928_005195 [Ogataea angusta]